jgi:hypothetical protein
VIGSSKYQANARYGRSSRWPARRLFASARRRKRCLKLCDVRAEIVLRPPLHTPVEVDKRVAERRQLRLAAALPETVNRLTPQGRLPSEDEARDLL